MGRDAPAYGYDAGANADDTYATIIAAGTSESDDAFNYIIAWCTTYDAIISIDGGTTDNIRIEGGEAPLKITFSPRITAVQAKNATATEDYTALYIIAGYEDR